MADGTRRRRHPPLAAKRRWYARHRSERFAQRFDRSCGESAATPTIHLARVRERTATVAAATAEDFELLSMHWRGGAIDAMDIWQGQPCETIAVA